MVNIKEFYYENKICNFTFDNESINKIVIDKFAQLINSNFGGIFFHVVIFVIFFNCAR